MIELKEIKPNDKQNLNIYCSLAKEIWSECYIKKYSQEMLEFQFDFLTPEIIKEQMKFDNLRYFLILKCSKEIGFIELKRREECFEISKIFIQENFRQQQTGKKAFELVKKIVKKENFSKITINIDENELDILKIFDNWGFKDIKQMARYIGLGVYIFCRNLEYYL